MKTIRSAPWLLTLVSLSTQIVIASDLSEEPFLLRLALAIDRASNYSDTAARLASAAYPGGSADNPAGDAFSSKPNKEQGIPLAFTTINAFSDSGAWITAAALTSAFHYSADSVLSGEYHYTKTMDSENNEGYESDLKAQEFVLGWSQLMKPDLSVGIRARLVPATIRHEARAAEVAFQPLRYDTDQFGADLWLGIMGRPSDKLTAGAVIRLGWAETDTTVKNLVPLGLVPSFTKLSKIEDDTQIRGLKLGMGYEASDELQFYTDLQYLRVHSNAAGAAEVGRASIGAQMGLSPIVEGIFGATYDSESELTLGLGLAIKPAEDTTLHITYQHNGAPEIEKEFGTVDYVNASLAIIF